MTAIRNFKRCPKCGKKYRWNPEESKMFCPHCGGTGFPIAGKPIFDHVQDMKPDVFIKK